MKLHLPKGLRNAVTACFAAIGGIAVTCASGTIIAGAATVALVAPQAMAALAGPAGVTYADAGAALTTEAPSGTYSADTAVTVNGGVTFGITASGYDVKVSGAEAISQLIMGEVNLANGDDKGTFWLAQGRAKIGEAGKFANVGDLYAGDGQLWFAAAYTGDNALTNNVHIGASTFSEEGNMYAQLNNSALRISSNVTMTGSLNVEEDAKISFQGGAVLALNGALTGSGNLRTEAYYDAASALEIGEGDISGYTGTISLGTNQTLRFNRYGARDNATLTGVTMDEGSVLQNLGSQESQQRHIGTLTVNGDASIAQTEWNVIWDVTTLTGSGALTYTHNGTHWSVSALKVADAAAYSGTLTLNVANTNTGNGSYQSYLELGSGMAGSVSLQGKDARYAVLALNADAATLGGLDGNVASVVFFGAAPTEEGSDSDHKGAALPEGQRGTLTLDTAEAHTYLGSLLSGVNLVKEGIGEQYIGSLADDAERTIRINSGALTIASLGAYQSIYVADGAVLNIPMSVSEAKQWGPENDRKTYYEWTSGVDTSKISGDGAVNGVAIAGIGSVTADDATCNYFNANGYAEKKLEVTSGKLAAFNPLSPADKADFGTVETVSLDGGGLFAASEYFSGSDARMDFDLALHIGEGGGWLADFGQGLNVNGSVSGTGALHKTFAGHTTLAGDMGGFSGSVSVEGGTLEIQQAATVSGLALANGTSLILDKGVSITGAQGIQTNGSATIALGEATTATGLMSIGENAQVSLSGKAGFNGSEAAYAGIHQQGKNSSLVITGSDTAISATRYVGTDDGGLESTTLRIEEGATLNLVGGNWAGNNQDTFVPGHWSSTNGGTVEILKGSLNALNTGITSVNGKTTITVGEEGILNIKALGLKHGNGGAATVNLNGGAIHIGELGIGCTATTATETDADLTLNIASGTLGILDSASSWKTYKELAVGEQGLTINTDLYNAATAAYTGGAGSIGLHGAVTGGTLTKTGVGTLLASSVGTLVVNEGYVQALAGGLSVDSLTLAANGQGRVYFSGGDATAITTASTFADTLYLTVADVEAGQTYTVFKGASGISCTKDNVQLVAERGLEIGEVIVEGDGTVKISVTGAASSDPMDLIWNNDGATDEWINSNVDNWLTEDGDATRFSSNDSVTFGTGASGTGETVQVNTEITAGGITIASSGYSFVGGGSILATSMAVNDGVTVTWDVSGSKYFADGVTLGAGSTLVLENSTGWVGAVSGESGTLDVATGATYTNGDLNLIAGTNADTLGTLKISRGTTIVQNSVAGGQWEWFQTAKDVLEIADGSRLTMAVDFAFGTDGRTPLLTKIAGAGTADAAQGSADAAALSFTGNTGLAGLELTDDATVYVTSGKSALVAANKKFILGSHTLTKTGAGRLDIGQNSGNSPVAADGSSYGEGTLDIQAGTVGLCLTNGAEEKEFGDVRMAAGTSLHVFDGNTSLKSLSVAGSVTLSNTWAKGMAVKGILTGDSDASVNLAQRSTGGFGLATLSLQGDNAYAGEVVVNGGWNVLAAHANALAHAEAVLNGEGIPEDSEAPALVLGDAATDYTVRGLSGSGGSVTTQTEGAAKTLTFASDAAAYSYGGSLANNLNIVKTGEGRQDLTGDLSAFTGNVKLDQGALGISSGLSLGSGRSLEATQGTILSTALTLNGGTLALHTTAGGSGVSLDGHALTLGATPTALDIKGFTADVTTTTEISLFTGLTDVFGSSGSSLVSSLQGEDGIRLSNCFDTTGLEQDALQVAVLKYRDGELYIAFSATVTSDLAWDNNDGTMTWKGDSPDNWAIPGGGPSTADTPDGVSVEFNGKGTGTVLVDGEVAPTSVTVKSGAYVFEQKEGTTGGISTDTFSIRGTADVTLALENANMNGAFKLGGDGTLTLAVGNALGNGSLVFDGGTLVYAAPAEGESVTWTDFSSRVTASEGVQLHVDVQGEGNSVTWGAFGTLLTANSGVRAALANGIAKDGAGTLTLAWAQHRTDTPDVNNAAISGDIAVNEGSLVLQAGDYGGPTFNFTGSISVAEGASFTFDAHSTANDRFNFNGSISGAGTVDLGKCTYNTGNSSRYGIVNLNGDNRDFHGTWILWGAGNTGNESRVHFGSANSLGAADATLELHGVYFYFDSAANTIAQNINIASGVNHFGSSSWSSGTAFKGYTFTGTLTGAADATLKSSVSGNKHSFAGNISGFLGTLDTNQATGSEASYPSTITFGGEGAASAGGEGNASAINAACLTGGGVYQVNYTEDTILNSVVGRGSAATKLANVGSGALILANSGNVTTQALTVGDNTVQIGYVEAAGSDAPVIHEANWAGTVAQAADTDGTLKLVAGRLDSATALAGYTGNVEVHTQGSTFDYGSNATDRLTSVTLEGGRLVNIGSFAVGGASACTTLAVTFGAGNVGTTATPADGAQSMISQTAGSTLALQGGATINMTIDAIIDVLKAHKDGGNESYLYLTDGALSLEDGAVVTFGSEAGILQGLGIRFKGVEGGALALTGLVEDIYVAEHDDAMTQTVNGYNTLQLFKATAVEQNTTLKLVLDGAPGDLDSTVNNLMGGTGSHFVAKNTNDAETAVVTLNNVLMEDLDPDNPWTPEGTAGADTLFAGDISTEGGPVMFVKEGAGNLTVQGDFTADALQLKEGGITLMGEGNGFATLSDEGEAGKTLTVNGELTLSGTGDAGSVLDDGTVLNGSGVLNLDGSLALSNGSAIDGLGVKLGDAAELELDGTEQNLATLSGTGTVNGSGAVANVANAANALFAGALAGTGDLRLADGAGVQNFLGVQGSGWNVTNGGSLVVSGEGGVMTSLGDLTLKSGSTTDFLVNGGVPAEIFTLAGNLVIEEGAIVNVAGFDGANFDGKSYTLGTAAGLVLESGAAGYDVVLGNGFMRYEAGALREEDGKIILDLEKTSHNLFAAYADSKNAKAGADLLWNADLEGTKDLKAASDALEALIAGGDRAGANRLMASAAGASIATLGSAFSGDVDRQLRAIRNRTTTMGVDKCFVNEGMPYFNAWANAEGDYRKVKADGTASGYTLSSWGGTLGFDVDFSPSFTAGLAITAMYGDLDASAPDKATGDLDTYYVSLFGRYVSRAWTHTFVGVIGRADASLDRTVNYGSGSYKTEGDTEGLGFALMYEAGYVIALNEDRTACIQPVANVAWKHTTIDGYSEKGSDAALHAGDQAMDVLTFGAGVRVQASIGETFYNRTAIFEARALAKADIGDRKADLDVALQRTSANIESAELGAVGIELGAGLTIPVGTEAGAIFFDASAELRSGYSNVNGTVGYRVNF